MESIEYKVVDTKGKPKGTVALDAKVFQAPVLEHLVHDVVVWQLAKRRSGTHSTLTRSMMLGGGKKPYKQKGTGNARRGSNISPLLVGGAVTFGPHPRDYKTRITKRSRLQALTSVLTEKVKESQLVVLDDLKLSRIKTKEITELLKNIGAEKGRSLILLKGNGDEGEKVIEKSSRNIAGVKTLSVSGINVYDLLYYKYLICSKEGIQALQERLERRN
ncbi:MAG: 50S ribosomal protein L4 [SAR324 cluster bacterium]|uniref:Large ribosomal subunit protein uL4 n=1 Tax=SAR324 cluster bacterium TaxID=2024889 RepID=A0A7X9FNX5_9DELT|nr:50S ribosomal protein L4 [SAR324 cluster bacterium]